MISFGKTKDKEHHLHFSSMLAAILKSNTQPQIKDSGTETSQETLKNTVRTVAKDVLGSSTKSKAKEWFDEECEVVTEARN